MNTIKVTVELAAGPQGRNRVTKREMQKNIDALQRAIDRKSYASDFMLFIDTQSILEGIQKQLPD